MDFKVLSKRFSDEIIIYVPSIEFPEASTVAEKSYPALSFSRLHSMIVDTHKYFYLLDSQIGEYEEHSEKVSHYYTDYFGGKEKIEERFLAMARDLRRHLRTGEEFAATA